MLIKHQRWELGENKAAGGSSICGSEAKGIWDSKGYGTLGPLGQRGILGRAEAPNHKPNWSVPTSYPSFPPLTPPPRPGLPPEGRPPAEVSYSQAVPRFLWSNRTGEGRG